MQIDSLKDLEKLVKLMRRTGIDKIKVDGIELELSSLPTTTRKTTKVVGTPEDMVFADGIGPNTHIPRPDNIQMPDELTPEQQLFYSSDSIEPVVEG